MSEHRVRLTGRGALSDPQSPAPTDERLADGQHADHWVLSDEERKKGFVRPVRTQYQHVGIPGPRYPLRELTEDEANRHADVGYVRFEAYPESERPKLGRWWTQEQLASVGKGCGTVTTMAVKIAETYAAQPAFYGRTFCVGCGAYLPVGQDGEFVWLDGERVGT